MVLREQIYKKNCTIVKNSKKTMQNRKMFFTIVGIPATRPYLVGVKESYHICFTSHEEVMFRDREDHGIFVNLMALRAFSMDTEILVDAEMSTHVHLGIFSGNPQQFAAALRMSYSKYFNRKYGRKGRIGEKYTFQLKIEGHVHQMVFQNYVLRNGLHHGASATTLGYPYCSARDMFVEDIGLLAEKPVSLSREDMCALLPRHSEFPDHYRMNAEGVFTRQSFMEIRRAEQYYGSPRNYLYQMNRLTDESWSREQFSDKTGAPLTIRDIEQADEKSITQMLKNESGRYYNRARMQDLDACRLIDKDLLPSFGATSVYQLTDSQKTQIARVLYHEHHLPEQLIRRCLVLPR